MDLFSRASLYPHSPGYRKRDTSKAAAKAMRPKANTVRQKIYAMFLGGFEWTADEACQYAEIGILTGRPARHRVGQARAARGHRAAPPKLIGS